MRISSTRSGGWSGHLSWNEIQDRAARFAAEWADTSYEKGESQTFYNEFFDVFGVSRRRVAAFEKQVKNLTHVTQYVDLFWKGVLLVERKNAERSLKDAREQALNHFVGLGEEEHPRYILLNGFQDFELLDLEDDEEFSFSLSDLPHHVERFGFIIGVHRKKFRVQDPVNIKASELVGELYRALEKSGYPGAGLDRFLVCIVFCLFADNTGIFQSRNSFLDFIEERTDPDGTDMGEWISLLFQTLGTPEDERESVLDADIAKFPFVSGDLFSGQTEIPSFDYKTRQHLIDACQFDWSSISPAIFGALFQSVMNKAQRREQGAHYTTEKNILKVVEPLFISDLRAEFTKLKARKDSRRRSELQKFHKRLANMTFFDPACGCGNFLIIAYREMRELEIELIREIRDYRADRMQGELDAADLSMLNVDQFYGIEIEEFPARVAEAALWMMDHIMNNRLRMEFGQSYARIPIRKSPSIVVGNALDMDWGDLLPASKCSFLLGNPPFRGHQMRSAEQVADMARIWGKTGQFNRLDYVTCWFRKVADYSGKNKDIDFAFVSTSSICQGEQCGILWPHMHSTGMSIHIAHHPFAWDSEAPGAAMVHCVIVGMTRSEPKSRTIYEYDQFQGDPHAFPASRINGYLIDGPQISIPARSHPPEGRLNMHKGSQPTDGARRRLPDGTNERQSNLILDEKDRKDLLARDPKAKKWLRPFVGGDELISGKKRWCLWLKAANPAELKHSPAIMERLDRVRNARAASPTASVREFANYPTLFTQDRQPDESYLALPEVSSETRDYIPMDILSSDVIASNKLQIIVGAPLLYFGILTSAMHMAWARTVAGRHGPGFSYAPAVYNSFPWPVMCKAQEQKIEALAQGVLDARQQFPKLSLDYLYGSLNMPSELRKAHRKLDSEVDKLYRRKAFRSDRERVEHLFQIFGTQDSPLENVPVRHRH